MGLKISIFAPPGLPSSFWWGGKVVEFYFLGEKWDLPPVSHFRFFGRVLGRFPEIVYPGNPQHCPYVDRVKRDRQTDILSV